MKHKTILSLPVPLLLLAVTGCQSPAGLGRQAPAWTAVYAAPWEAMANCIAERERSPLATVTPSFFAAERRATVAVTTPTGAAVGVYEIRALPGSGGTEVSYSSVFGGPASGAGGGAFDKARQCGNAA